MDLSMKIVGNSRSKSCREMEDDANGAADWGRASRIFGFAATAQLRQPFGLEGSSHSGFARIAWPQNFGHDTSVFSFVPGAITECGQVAGWGDWGEAAVGWTGSVLSGNDDDLYG